MKSAVFLAAAVVLLSACSSLQTVRRPGEQDAGMLLARISHINAGIRDIKGIGRLRLATGATRNSARVALAGTADGALRIDLIGIDGRPLANLAANGTWLSFRGYRPYQFHRRPSSSASLEKILSIPVAVKEAVLLLCGRIPVVAHQEAVLLPAQDDEAARILLKGFWGRVKQTIDLGGDGVTPVAAAFFDAGGDLRYHVHRFDLRPTGGYPIPFGLTLTGGSGALVTLTFDRLSTDTGLPDDLFVRRDAPPQ